MSTPQHAGPHFNISHIVGDTTVLEVDIQTPNVEDGKYPYRTHVTAQLSLTAPRLRQFRNVVLSSDALPDQLVLGYYAECTSCISSLHPSSSHSKCHPTFFYLDPKSGPKHSQPLKLDRSSGIFTGTVTFNIAHRPRKPKPQDQTSPRRCATEALMLTFFVRNSVGEPVAGKTIGPFQARVHRAKEKVDHQQHADGLHRSVPSAVLSLPDPRAPLDNAQVYHREPYLPCPCYYCWDCLHRSGSHAVLPLPYVPPTSAILPRDDYWALHPLCTCSHCSYRLIHNHPNG